jgi:thiol-disulfide isomerase/thioredoxin
MARAVGPRRRDGPACTTRVTGRYASPMTSIQLGPLALPTAPLLWLLALFASLWLARVWAGRRGGSEAAALAEEALWRAAAVGFAASRLMFVLPAWADYAPTPWALLDLRDGGWAPAYGVLAGAAVLAWHAGRRQTLRTPLAAAGTLALALWGAGAVGLGLHRALPVPDIALVDLDGRAARLPELAQGRPVVVNLWASWCAPCRVELPALAAAQAAHPAVRFLYVNQGEDAATARRFVASLPFALDGVWLDRRGAAALAADSSGLPTTLIFDPEGRLVERHMGSVTEAVLRHHLRPWRKADG